VRLRYGGANGSRYEILAGKEDWKNAEKQIKDAVLKSGEKEGRSTVVSVKTGKSVAKRKAGETAAEIYEEEVAKLKHKPKKGKR
jgi:N-acetyltransferase 10